MWLKWLFWKYMVRRLAKSHGFADPIAILSHIRRFAQPSEVNEPIELLRAGIVFHSRGLINSRVIQHNLDWVWPYWVNRQFRPESNAFIPRASSLTHINLSGRNWTAVGLPGFDELPVVDPRGMVMPFWDSWSVDAWIVADDGRMIVPAKMEQIDQKLNTSGNLSVNTVCDREGFYLSSEVSVEIANGRRFCCINLLARGQTPGWLVLSLRPYNTEGVSFIRKIKFTPENSAWRINEKSNVFLSATPDRHYTSDYENGDVSLDLLNRTNQKEKVTCKVGMATAAAMYRLEPQNKREVQVLIPLQKEKSTVIKPSFAAKSNGTLWSDALADYCRVHLPNDDFQFLYEAAVRSVVLHSPGDVYPGPFTYKRFWFRDAVFIIYAILRAGMTKRAEKLIDNFLPRQTAFGYFHSQQGEWDSNGQVLWLMNQYCRLSGDKPKDSWLRPVLKAARWICNKRLSQPRHIGTPHAGLLPAGFSAEHLGPNDYYYWDDFWSVAGLRAAADILEGTKYNSETQRFKNEAEKLLQAVEDSLASCRNRIGRAAMPASPYRRLDSGAVGSLVACYPLGLFDAGDERVRDTVNFLMAHCIIKGAFYHDISHSGINVYLTLQLAQVLMREGDIRFTEVLKSVAELASPTGQWPEAINPRTGAGCMGDGQHIWASAEWIIMLASCFAAERDGKLIIASGIFPQWLKNNNELSAGPLATSWGPVYINIVQQEEKVTVSWLGCWRKDPPDIEVRLPGFEPVSAGTGETAVMPERK